MDKTININLGGSLFQVDEEAYITLRDYIQAINRRFRNVQGGNETIDDIEVRIAEIFRSQKGIAGVITKVNVDAMIGIIGKPDDFATGITEEETQPVQSGKRLYRNPDDRIVSGVCGGLGAYFNTDPVLFRVLFILFTFFFFTGMLIYIALWIAVPSADNDSRKREMYGKNYYAASAGFNEKSGGSRLGNVFNDTIEGVGRILFFIMRIFLITFGITFVITGFLAILTFVMVFIFKYPGAFSHHDISFNISYLPEMLRYIFSPAAAPWITGLATAVFVLPMLALIYWGVRMIFWFRVRDGIFNLAGLVLWVMCGAALSIIMFSEGVSFAESSSSTSRYTMNDKPDTLFIVSGKRIADVEFEKEFSIPDVSNVMLVDSSDNIYLRPTLKFRVSEDGTAGMEVRKRSSGRTRNEASDKSGSLVYNYLIRNDSVYLDEYFMIPSGQKWSADFVTIRLVVPEKTILYFDGTAARLTNNTIEISRKQNDEEYSGIDFDTEPDELKERFWIFSRDGLQEASPGK